MKSLFARLSVAAVSVVAAVSAGASTQDPELFRHKIEIELKESAPYEVAVSALANSGGRLEKKLDNGLVISVNLDVDLPAFIEALESRKSVKDATAIAPKMPDPHQDWNSVSWLGALVEQYEKAYLAYEMAEDAKRDNEDEVPGLDFLQAYLQWVKIRAFPNDEVDWSGYTRAYESKRAQGLPDDYIRPLNGGGEVPQWEFVGPTNHRAPAGAGSGEGATTGRVNAVAFDPTDSSRFFVAGAQGGVWRTEDNGENWEPLTDSFPMISASSITIDPINPDHIYIGTGDYHGFDKPGIGVLKSTDGGDTFVQYGSEMGGARVSDIAVDPLDNQRVLAATSFGLFVSENAGETWIIELEGNYSAMDSTADGRRLWVVKIGDEGLVRTSIDFGREWVEVEIDDYDEDQGSVDIASSKIDNDTAYILSTSQGQIFKTEDGGLNWEDTTNNFADSFAQGWFDYHIDTSYRFEDDDTPAPGGGGSLRPEIGTDPGDRVDVVYVGLINLSASIDGGETWRFIGGADFQHQYTDDAYIHVDHHSFAVNPQDPDDFLVGNDGGVYRGSYDQELDLFTYETDLNENLGLTQFYRIAAHPDDIDYMMGGTQDNATPHTFGDIFNWLNPGVGDGAGVAINHNEPDIQYLSTPGQFIRMTEDEWVSDPLLLGTVPGLRPFIGKIFLDHSDPRYLYVPSNLLNRFDSDTMEWSYVLGNQALVFTPFGIVWAFDSAPSDKNIMYTGSTDGALFASILFGRGWFEIGHLGGDKELPFAAYTSISVNPNNPFDILVTTAGFGNNVFRCSDTLAIPTVWEPVSDGLELPITDLVRDPDDPEETWYVSTDIGVYMTSDAGANWEDITVSRGLPNVEVNDLAWVKTPTNKALYAGTYGRGMWRMTFAKEAKLANFVVSPSVISSSDVSFGTVTLDSPAPAGGLEVSILSSLNIVDIPSSILIPEGQTVGGFPIVPNGNGAGSTHTTNIIVEAGGLKLQDTLTIKPLALETAVFTPQSASTGDTVTLKITLNGPAGTGGFEMSLSGSHPALGLPTTVTIPQGDDSIEIQVPIGAVLAPTRAYATIDSAINSRRAYIYLGP